MTKWLTACALAIGFACVFAMPAARAVEQVTVIEPGTWSAWSEEAAEPSAELEVESEVQTRYRDRAVWTYTRYVYYNTESQSWFTAPHEVTGDFVLADSGYWDEKSVDAPLNVLDMSTEDPMYEDGWYNERADTAQDPYEATVYRTRALKTAVCEISTTELLVFPEKTRQLTANLYDGEAGYYAWESSDQTVATVDASGNVTGRAVGTATVTVTSPSGRRIACEVYVCQKNAKVPDGTYTIRLNKSDKTLSAGKRISETRRRLIVADYTGERAQRFLLTNIGQQNTFTLHPLINKSMNVDIARGKDAPTVGDDVQLHTKRDRMAQYWRCVYVPDGSYIFYPKADAKLFLGAIPADAGNGVKLETMTEMELLDRWVLVRTGESSEPTNAFVRPVIRDGLSFVAKDYSEEDKAGITFGSNGRRVFVLACGQGTVVEVGVTCAHDAVKQAAEGEAMYDPCGSLGNYVVIDHGEGLRFTYAHLSRVFVKVGDTVRQSAIIGRSGATGATAEVCLLLSVTKDGEPVNPRDYVNLPEVNKSIG